MSLVTVTVDMDNYQDYQSLVDRDGRADAASFYADAVPRFLELLARFELRATFFVVGRDAVVPAHGPVLRAIAAAGHEVANHSWSHPYNFRGLPRAEKEREIATAEAAIADAVGERPVGFRTPSCDVDAETLAVLGERGYLYDSSIFPTPVMWAFMVYGKLFVRRPDYKLGHPAAVFAPPRPYRPSARRAYRRCAPGERTPGPLEIPVAVVPGLRVPFYTTLLRLFGPAGFRLLVRARDRRSPLHVLFHLIELADLTSSSLGDALSRTPGLGLPLARRERFVAAAFEILAGAGTPGTMRELAEAWTVAHPCDEAAHAG